MTASLAQTAQSWSAPPGHDDAGDVPRTFVTFDLGSQTLAADVTDVREILDLQEISPLPNASAGLLGMIDLRGEGIAVIDLALSLGLSRQELDRDSRIIVLDLAQREGLAVAIMADRVRKVIELGDADVDAVPQVPGGWNAGAMSGVARVDGRLVYLVDLRQALGQISGTALPGPFDFD